MCVFIFFCTFLFRVEHLHPEVLDGFWKTVLGDYSPRLVIVTTPNAEFNVNFPQLMYGTSDSTFRHWDHKFEWTRKQFEDWYDFYYGIFSW